MSRPFLPKISCLMVTANRKRFLRRSLLCYQKQTYPDKELVIIDDGQEDLADALDFLPRNEVIYNKIPKKTENVLGHLRNLALEMASGDLLVQWDDDDWYHPDRLKVQAEGLSEGIEMSCLSNALFHLDIRPFFDFPFVSSFRKGVPGSIMHARNSSIRYQRIALGEDDIYLKAWRKRSHKKLGADYAYLFIRCYHGDNSWDAVHFRRRLYNSPGKLIGYAWNRFFRKDLFRHRPFRLDEKCKRSFSLFIEDSFKTGIF